MYRRIEAIAKVGDVYKVLDVTEPAVRMAIVEASTIKELYEGPVSAIYM